MTDRIPDSVIEAMMKVIAAHFNIHASNCKSIVREQLHAAEAHDPPFKLIGGEPTNEMKRQAADYLSITPGGATNACAGNVYQAAWHVAPGVGK